MRIMKFSGAFIISVTLYLLILLSIGIKVDYPNHSELTILELVDSTEEKLYVSENSKPIEQNYVLKRFPSIVDIGDLSTPHVKTPENKNLGVLDIPQIDLKLTDNSEVEFLVEVKSQPILSEGLVEKNINAVVKYQKIGVVRDALGSVAESITLGNVEVPPLSIPPPPKGEAGGRVIGKGRIPQNNSGDPLDQSPKGEAGGRVIGKGRTPQNNSGDPLDQLQIPSVVHNLPTVNQNNRNILRNPKTKVRVVEQVQQNRNTAPKEKKKVVVKPMLPDNSTRVIISIDSSPQQNLSNPPNSAVYNDVYHKNYGTNPFIDTEDENLSTFGMDVDTASYSMTQRYLRDNYLPPPEAIRVEEFINSFDYNYEPPKDETFAIQIEGAPSKFGEGKRLKMLRIGIQGRDIPDTHRQDAILTFVIDVSGSMKDENRLELVKNALRFLLNQLRPGDKVGIAAFRNYAYVVLPHTGIENREFILQAINKLYADGSTNAEAGLRIGYDLALKNLRANSINRVILCSDGVANQGQTGYEAILNEINRYVEEGITLTTVGFGMGNYNDVLLEQLANNGNGSYTYVNTLKEARRIFEEDLTGTLQTIAKDAKIQVEFNPETVSRFRLIGYENRSLAHEDFRKDDVDAGEVGAGHSVTALYEIKLHKEVNGKLATVYIRHEESDTQEVEEISQAITIEELKPTFNDTTLEFQFVATVAEFAEILRGSHWAKHGNLEVVQQVLERVLPQIQSNTVQEKQRKDELLNLVRIVRRLKKQVEG